MEMKARAKARLANKDALVTGDGEQGVGLDIAATVTGRKLALV